MDRAARDAERVRGWLGTYDRDFLVRVYAAIVTDDRRGRTVGRLRGGCTRSVRGVAAGPAAAARPHG